MKVIDCVLAFDESEILKFRHQYLGDVIDEFFVFEANVSFSGVERSAYLSDAYESTLPRTQFVRIEVPTGVLKIGNPWEVEEYCRDWSMEFIARRFPKDAIVFTDIDEIPSVDQISRLPFFLDENSRGSIPTITAYRRANWLSNRGLPDWKKPKVFRGSTRIPGLRYAKCPAIPGEPGAHLRYMGYTPERVAQKFKNFSHQELNRNILSSPRYLEFADKFGLNHLAEIDTPGFGILTVVERADYSDVLIALSQAKPEWFSTDNIHLKSFARRVAYTQLVLARNFNSLRPLEKSRGIWKVALIYLASLIHYLVVSLRIPVMVRVSGRLKKSGWSPSPGQSLSQWLAGLNSVPSRLNEYSEPGAVGGRFFGSQNDFE